MRTDRCRDTKGWRGWNRSWAEKATLGRANDHARLRVRLRLVMGVGQPQFQDRYVICEAGRAGGRSQILQNRVERRGGIQRRVSEQLLELLQRKEVVFATTDLVGPV